MRTDKRIFALGFFDGVHLGHQALLKECCRLAEQQEAVTAAITFDRHPQSLFMQNTPSLLSTVQDRQRLLQQYGMERVWLFPVTEMVMSMPWREFLGRLLSSGAVGFVCGDDFRFGHRGEGDAQKLKEFCDEQKLPCVIVPEQTVDGRRISSTYIRTQIECGDMETATRYLGHPYVISGMVIPGHQLGRKLGIPTANLLLPPELAAPKFGVYACLCELDGKRYPAVTNIGTRPTVSGTGVTVEPWILDFEGDLYGREITLEFYRFLRPEQKFPDLSALQAEIRKNAEETRRFFAKR